MSDRVSGIEWDRRIGIQAWMYSLGLHAAIIALTAALGARMTLAPQEEPFRWNVAMVEPVSSQDSATQTPSAPASTPEAEPTPQSVVQPVQQRVAPTPVERRVDTAPRPVIRQTETKPHESIVERAVEPVKSIEPTKRTTEVRPSAVEATPTVATHAEPAPAPIERSVDEPSPAPVQQRVETSRAQPTEEVVHRPEPSHQAATTVEEPRPTITERAVAQSIEQAPDHVVQPSVDPASVFQHRDTPSAGLQSDSVQPAQSAETTSTPERPAQEERTVVAKAVPSTTPSLRRDYGWVRDALWRRIVEMKHYPSQARLNHLEGKVVLRAVIKSDGNLGDLSIKESSGHRILDEAAMEVIRRICPVPLKHDLGKPEIVVMIPIDYRLE